MILVASAALVGGLAWNGKLLTLSLLPLIVWIWRESQSRFKAFCALFAYYLTASRGLLTGSCVFFSNPFAPPAWWVGWLVWILPNAVLAASWALCWTRSYRSLGLLFCLVLISFPPIGLIGWANPLTAAGILFPGTGWLGLALLVMLFILLVELPKPAFKYSLLAFLAVAGILNANHKHSPSPKEWIGLDTYHLPSSSVLGEFQLFTKSTAINHEERALGASEHAFFTP